MTSPRRLLPALLALFVTVFASAQVSYTGGTYSENFNGLPSSGTFTFSGVGPHAVPGGTGWTFAKVNGSGANALFAVGTGSSNTGSVYSFGPSGNADRALGTLLSGTTGSAIGVVLVNDSGGTVTEITVKYTGEQWRYGGTTGTDKLTFEYQLGATSITAGGTFTSVPALDFSSKVNGTTGGTTGALDGNASGNRQTLTATISGLNWTTGQSLAIRWSDFNVTGSDDGLAVDEFSLSSSGSSAPIPPTVTAVSPANGATGVSSGTNVSVTFSTATSVSGAWYQLTGSTSGAHAATVTGGPTTFTLAPTVAFAEGETVTLNLTASLITDAATGTAPMASNFSSSFSTEVTVPIAIHTVQGSGTASPLAGQQVTTEGIVTAVFPGLSGFYLQTPASGYDADPATSEGLFVFNTTFPVNVGDAIRLRGTVQEFGTSPLTETELTGVIWLNVLSTGNPLPAPVTVTLPFASATAAEAWEGMRVSLPQSLTVTDNFDLGHFGEIFLSNGRLNTPTNVVSPGAPAAALEAQNLLNQLLVDDGVSAGYPDPTPFLADSNGRGATRRTGSTVANAAGILDQKFGSYILEPTGALSFTDANPRNDPPAVAGTLKVAIGNVLNFDNGDGAGGGFPTSRGADSFAEYQRQRAKIVAGISAVLPDIMGLTEVENDRITNGAPNSYGPLSAIADLVNGLNAVAPSGVTYAYVDASAVDIVTDVIHCAFIYRTDKVVPVGAPAMLNDASFNNLARNPLAQTFQQLANGERLTVCINHFRAKGSAATSAAATDGISPNPNLDTGDGQGTNNYLRIKQANALTAWLATDPTGSGDPDFLIIGDLNAYAKENPITALEGAGYINLTEAAEGTGGYSYAFAGEFGHLDHALANGHLAGQVVDAATWHVNSDEPVYYDYNLENKNAAQQAVNATGPYRYSDHDPVVVGLKLQPDPAADKTSSLLISKGPISLNKTTGRYKQTIALRNMSSTPLAAPLSLVFTNLPAGVTVYTPTGTTQVVTPLGSPYLNVNVGADNLLSPSESASVVVEYVNPGAVAITYTLKALAGPGGR